MSVARLTKVAENLERDLTTWKLLLILFAGALVGLIVVYGDYPWWDEYHRDFAGNGALTLWIGLTCAQTALWAVALVWLSSRVGRLRSEYRDENRGEVVYSTALLVVITALLITGPLTNPWPDFLPHHAAKNIVLTIVGVLIGLVAARGVWFVHGGLKKLEVGDMGAESALKTFLSLQSDLRRFLATLGAILGLLILTASAQRQAILAYKPDTDYGYQLVLVYGFFFSMLVAAVYLPTKLTLDRVGNGIRDANFPALPPTSPEWRSRTEERETLGNMLDLKAGPLGQFRASVAILTPLVGSLIGLLLK